MVRDMCIYAGDRYSRQALHHFSFHAVCHLLTRITDFSKRPSDNYMAEKVNPYKREN